MSKPRCCRPTVDLKLSNTLFELLLPATLKNSIRHGGDILMLLNPAAARYPFELMADRENTAGPVPLITKCGLLRQLELRETPRKTDITSGRDILVIGPPLAPAWPTLAGAREEAHRIADLCRDRGYRPTLLVNATSRAVQTEVFASDARVLHVAAHGQYSDNPFESGIVIGDDEYFTTANVAAMRRVPEFVFLNCCHLGRLGSEAARQTAFPALAASLAEGFMSAGVRAVIAAGWSVDDAAGLTFARTFYERFLAGELYGEAVRAARLETFARHPGTSTWGAFQCYGSPEYRLRSTASAERPRFTKPPVSRGELIARLRSLAERAGGARAGELTRLVDEFQAQKKMILEGGRWNDGETLAELANLAAKLEEFPEAIELYRQALGVAKALAPLQAVEQLANMLGREAPRLAVTKGSGAAEQAIALFKEAIDWLDWLDKRLPPTDERLALRGSVHKRWAMLTDGPSGSNTCATHGRPMAMRGSKPGQGVVSAPELAGAQLPAQEAAPRGARVTGPAGTGSGRSEERQPRRSILLGPRRCTRCAAARRAVRGHAESVQGYRRNRRRLRQRAGDRADRTRPRLGTRSPRVPGGNAARPGVETENGCAPGRRAPAAHRTAALKCMDRFTQPSA